MEEKIESKNEDANESLVILQTLRQILRFENNLFSEPQYFVLI
jgi:hypothetical protein